MIVLENTCHSGPKSFLRSGDFCCDERTTKPLDQMLVYLTEREGTVGMYFVAVFGMKEVISKSLKTGLF